MESFNLVLREFVEVAEVPHLCCPYPNFHPKPALGFEVVRDAAGASAVEEAIRKDVAIEQQLEWERNHDAHFGSRGCKGRGCAQCSLQQGGAGARTAPS